MERIFNELIWIPYNVPSLKNSKIKTSRGIFPSKTVKNYLSDLGIQKYSSSKKEVIGYKTKPNLFENLREQFNKELKGCKPPFEIGLHFVRNSSRKFDFNNASQIIADLMVAHNFIEDDNMDYFLPYPLKINGNAYTIDKNNPGVYIKIKKPKNLIMITEELKELMMISLDDEIYNKVLDLLKKDNFNEARLIIDAEIENIENNLQMDEKNIHLLNNLKRSEDIIINLLHD